MRQQTKQPQKQAEDKKFGKYYVKEESSKCSNTFLLIEPINTISSKLDNGIKKYPEDIILAEECDLSTDDCGALMEIYHIKDTTVSIFGGGYQNHVTLSIYHPNQNKRQKARKFLEEILS